MGLARFAAFVLTAFLAACSGAGNVDINLENPRFPSLAGEPAGGDAQSSSTNFSQKLFDPSQKADPLAGAGYIPIPQMTNYGGVSFSYPLEIPKGRAGVEPKISLSYSSSGGDGWLGVGWNLGLGAITRTTQYGQLFYDGRDVYTYGGKRLIKVSGPANSENGVYRLEIDDGSFARLELTGIETGGVWTVFDKSGTKIFYGENLSERIYVPGANTKTYSWQFTRTVDLNGNFLRAVYDDSLYATNHVLYLKEIRYTGNTAAGFDAYQYVRFKLKSRSDAYTSRAPGFAMKVDQLLDVIEVGWQNPSGGESKLWDYTMEYITSADSNRPLVERIKSSRTSTHPKFTYQQAQHTLGWTQVTNVFASDPEMNPKSTQYLEGDFNGDGKSDFCFFNPENGLWKVVASSHTGSYVFQTWGNRFQGYKGETKIQWFKGNVTGDYNGDGKSDIAFYLPETKEFYVAESTGTNFNFKLYGKFTLTQFDLFKSEWFTGDFDGNGLSDAILFDEGTGSWILMKNKGGYFTFQQIGYTFQHLYRKDFTPSIGNNSPATRDLSAEGEDRGKIHWLSGDFNGDGKSDFSFYDQRNGKWWVGKVEVTGSELTNTTCKASPMDCTPSVTWQLYKVFTAPEQTLFGHDRFSGDFNGDGLSDFLLFDRASGQFWLGETTEPVWNGTGLQPTPTINFRIFSTAPQFKDITRWLQGDFNGDGRTDIGFYSSTDNNFWIGEASPTGFRFRIYNNMNGGPDPARVIAAAPLPQDDITPKEVTANIPGSGKTAKMKFAYDSNAGSPTISGASDRGEIPFLGCFTQASCTTGSDLSFLVYNRKTDKFRLKTAATAITDVLTLDVDGTSRQFLTQPRPSAVAARGISLNGTGKEGVLIYELGQTNHIFSWVNQQSAGIFQSTPVASFQKSQSGGIVNFDIKESAWFINDFTGLGNKEIMVLDDQTSGSALRFVRLTAGLPAEYSVSGDGTTGANAVIKKEMFKSGTGATNRTDRDKFKFFTGHFTVNTNQPAQLLIVDMRTAPHKYYLGTINSSTNIDFKLLNTSGSVDLPSGQGEEFPEFGNTVTLQTLGEQIFYVTRANGQIQFHRLNIAAGSTPTISLVHYNAFAADYGFAWEFDHTGRPLLTGATLTAVNFSGSASYTLQAITSGDNTFVDVAVDRSDLYQSIYPFQWLQGDYNGDGKTDIGFFHMKEPKWYFANTSGTVPDMVGQVENGIGGMYLFDYANSSSFDNTGGDGIYDLPMNYKVCTKLTVRDGLGNEYINNYSYKNGFAYSGFWNGRKETDYFGFSEFLTVDAMGSQTLNHYSRTPFGTADFASVMKNRAVSGAVTDSTFNGWDQHEYSKTLSTYQVKTVATPGVDPTYVLVPDTTEKYIQGTKTQTQAKQFTIPANQFQVDKVVETTTDHYTDAARPQVTLTNETNFETIAATNQQRVTTQLTLKGSAHEVTATSIYDSRGNAVQTTQHYSGSGLQGAPDRVTEYQYDNFGNRIAQEDKSATPSRRSEFVFDTTLYQYVAEERMVGNAITLIQKAEYDFAQGFGKPKTVTNPNNRKRYFTYDAAGRITRVEADTDSGVQTLSDFAYSASGADTTNAPLSAKTMQYSGTGASDVATRVFKDGVGRELHTVQSGLGSSGKRYTKTGKRTYDALGRVIRQSQQAWAQDDEIDTFKAHVSELNPTVTEYDASGRVKKVMSPKADAAEAETSVTTTYNDPWEVVTVHSAGQAKRTIHNARGHELFVEDFHTAEGLTAKMYFCYDLAGNRVKRADTTGSVGGSDCSIPGNAFSGRDASGNNISYWKYDGLGQNVQVSDPDLGVTGIVYTAFGQVATKTDARNFQTSYFYDRLGRLTQKVLPNGEGNVYLAYDTLAGAENAVGQLVQLTDNEQRKSFSYDVLGRKKQEIRELRTTSGATTFGNGYVTRMANDLMDRTTAIDYPVDPVSGNGIRICYGYNAFGLVSGVSAHLSLSGSACSDKTLVSNIVYNEFRQIDSMTRGNGITTRYDYDVKRRVKTLFYANGSGDLTRTDYSYSIQNSITKKVTAPIGAGAGFQGYTADVDYDYDGLNRLVEASGQTLTATASSHLPKKFAQTFAYTPHGNLSQKQILDFDTQAVTDQWNYSYTNHRVTSVTTTKYGGTRFSLTYDSVGNTLGRTDLAVEQKAHETAAPASTSLIQLQTYDSKNRIRTVANGATSTTMGTYAYDDEGFRVRRTSLEKSATAPDRVYEVEAANKYFALERQKDLNGTAIANTTYAVNNVYLDGVRIASLVNTGHARYFLTDQVDSVNVVTNDAGQAITRTEYLPYGETWFMEGDKNYAPKFNSQELDKESNFYFMNARHYDPELARFVTADSITDGDNAYASWNRYMYVHGNPVMYKDPTGHLSIMGVKISDHEPTDAEIAVRDKDPAPMNALAANKLQAEKMSEQLTKKGVFEKNGLHNGQADAFRHAYASALTAKKYGADRAITAANAHESYLDTDGKMLPDKNIEAEMDRRNNAAGAKLGASMKNATNEEIADALVQKIKKGDLYIIKPTNDRVDTVNSEYKKNMQANTQNGASPESAATVLRNSYRRALYANGSDSGDGRATTGTYELVRSNQYQYKSDKTLEKDLTRLVK